MKIVKFFLSALDKRTKKHQKEEFKKDAKMDFSDLWNNFDDEGKEALKKEMNDTAKIRTSIDKPKEN